MENCNARPTFAPLYKMILFFFALLMFMAGGVKTVWASDYTYVYVRCYNPDGSFKTLYSHSESHFYVSNFYQYDVYDVKSNRRKTYVSETEGNPNAGGIGSDDYYFFDMFSTQLGRSYEIRNIRATSKYPEISYIGPSVVPFKGGDDVTLYFEYGHNSKGSGYDQTDTQHRRYTCCSYHPSENRSYGSWQDHSWTTTRDWHVYNDTTLHQDQKCSVCGRTRTNSKPRHTHNSNGVGYNINDTQHQKYTYCNGHGSDTTQNRQYGSWENHTWVHKNNTTDECICGKTRTRTYWVNVSVLSPDHMEDFNSGKENGYFRVSTDKTNWSDKVTDQPYDPCDILQYNQKLYIEWMGVAKDYLELKDVYVVHNEPAQKLSDYTFYHNATSGESLSKVGENIFEYTVTNDYEDGAVTFAQCIHFQTDYKHTTLTLNPNGGSINGNTEAQALSPKLQYSTVQWNNLSTKKPSKTGYTFTGWFDAASGGTKVYNADGTCVRGTKYFDSSGNSLMTSDITLYAQWSINTYHIYYTLYGSSASVKRTYVITDNAFTLPMPSLSGYTFKGWIGGIDKKDPVRDANGKIYSTPTGSITVPKGTYGDYFFRAVFEKNHSSVNGDRTDDVYVAHSEVKEKQY